LRRGAGDPLRRPAVVVAAVAHHHRSGVIGLTPGCLPAGLTELCWDGAIGNGLVAGLLPPSLHVLRLADRPFNGSLDGVLPPDSQLESLSFGGEGFVLPFQSDTLPRSLRT
jgi:hypothetical protein